MAPTLAGHVEPAAGLVGLLVVVRSFLQRAYGVNAQLRALNNLLVSPLRGLDAFVSTQGMILTCEGHGTAAEGFNIYSASLTTQRAKHFPFEIQLLQARKLSLH